MMPNRSGKEVSECTIVIVSAINIELKWEGQAMKKLSIIYTFIIIFAGFLDITYALEVNVHGDLNNRFQVTNRADFLTGDSKSNRPEINDGDVNSNFGEIKYRLWMDADDY